MARPGFEHAGHAIMARRGTIGGKRAPYFARKLSVCCFLYSSFFLLATCALHAADSPTASEVNAALIEVGKGEGLTLPQVAKAVDDARSIDDLVKSPSWNAEKFEKLSCLVLALGLLDQISDDKLDLSVPPLLKVLPPKGAEIMAGQSPADIKDEGLRKESAAAIAANKSYESLYKTQWAIDREVKSLVNYISLFVGHYFSAKEKNRAALMIADSVKRLRSKRVSAAAESLKSLGYSP